MLFLFLLINIGSTVSILRNDYVYSSDQLTAADIEAYGGSDSDYNNYDKDDVNLAILHGSEGMFPEMSYLVRIGEVCTGVILTESWILTTLYCRRNAEAAIQDGQNIKVTAGNGNFSATREVERHVDGTITPQKNSSLVNLFSCLKLANPLKFNHAISSAPQIGYRLHDYKEKCVIAGFGEELDNGNLVSTDEPAKLEVIAGTPSQGMCSCIEESVGYNLFCVKLTEKSGPCFSDFGGPLICEDKVVALFAYFFEDTCEMSSPSVFKYRLQVLNEAPVKYCGNPEMIAAYIELIGFRNWIAKTTGVYIGNKTQTVTSSTETLTKKHEKIHGRGNTPLTRHKISGTSKISTQSSPIMFLLCCIYHYLLF